MRFVEVRCFFVAGSLAARIRYWPGQMENAPDVPKNLLALAGRIDSPFFTMDFAQREDGGWTVIETGDGQVPASRRARMGCGPST